MKVIRTFLICCLVVTLVFDSVGMLYVSAETSGETDAQTEELSNLALKGVASCITDEGVVGAAAYENEASRAIDGNTDTYFQAHNTQNPLANLFVDLGDTYEISKISILSSAKNYATKFKLEYSTDNIEWEIIQEVEWTSAPTADNYVDFEFEAVEARYVRMDVMSNATEWPSTIKEFQIWGKEVVDSEDNQENEDLEGMENLALKGVASCITDEGVEGAVAYENEASRAIDGNSDTYFQAHNTQNPLANLFVDLGDTYEINKISILSSAKNYATKFKLEYSTDNMEWKIIQEVEWSSEPPADNYVDFEFEAVEARYVRMDVMSNATEWPSTIKEFQIWGKEIVNSGDNQEDIVIPQGLDNLALKGSATCITDNGTQGEYWHAPSQAIDDNESSFYQANEKINALANLCIDLGTNCEVSKISILSSTKNYATKFKLEHSLDNKNWTTLQEVEQEAAPTAGNYEQYIFDTVKTRYIRMDIIENGGDASAAIFEFQVWGKELEVREDMIDLALNGTASMDYPCAAGSNYEHSAACAIDGNYNSSSYAQSADADAPWSLTVDLNFVCAISRIKLETSKKNYATDFTIEISDDATTWKEINKVTGFTGGVHEFELDSVVRTKYIRMHVTDVVHQGFGHTIFYFSVYGTYAEVEPDTSVLGTSIIDTKNVSVNASSEKEDHVAENIIDGKDDTYWSPGESGEQTLTIDLKDYYNFTGILIKGSCSAVKLIDVASSEDNLRWYLDKSVLISSKGAGITCFQDYRRYIKITFPNVSELKINEIVFYGSKSETGMVLSVNANEIADRPVLIPIPVNVSGVAENILSLNGEWKFSLEPEIGYWENGTSRSDWSNVTVPGDAYAQGYIPYTIAENDQEYQHESAFERTFELPAGFAGKRVILRVNGAVNYSRLWVNGKFVRTHRSGKTSWDTDITEYVNVGEENRITIGLTCENPQVDFSRIRGLTGDITLCALPQDYLSRLHVITDFDENYENATLKIQTGIVFNSQETGKVKFILTDSNGQNVALQNSELNLISDANSQIIEQEVNNTIQSPMKWDAEHPNLYLLTAVLYNSDNLETERVQIKIGFREIEVSGTKILVNGDSIKLRGANYTDTNPLIGVAKNEEYQRNILEKFKAANINFIRTAHCPQTEYFYALCDEMGFYVESEASVFFIGMSNVSQINPDWLKNDESYADCFTNAVSEMIEEYKSHPSIVYWSIANESNWGDNNELCHTYARYEDPTRPTKFSWGAQAKGKTEIYSNHYGNDGVSSTQPTIKDEYAHGIISVNEEKIDPGYQDCAENVVNLWEEIYKSDKYQGGAIWAAVDRMYYTNGAINSKYNTANGNGWGFLDAWGREKPMYWNVKKAYSPFKILDETRIFENPGNDTLSILVENRFNHSNLSECTVSWSVGAESGTMSGPNIESRSSGMLVIPKRNWKDGDVLKLTITYQNLVIDEYELSIGKKSAPDLPVADVTEEVTVDSQNLIVCGEKFKIKFDAVTGLITLGEYNNEQIICGGPYLNLGTGTVGTWSLTSISMEKVDENAVVTIVGKYGTSIDATYTLTIDATGLIVTAFNITGITSCNEIGVAYIVPEKVESLSWMKNGYWSVYPENHIGRNTGTAMKVYADGEYALTEKPTCEWGHDMKFYFMFGNNDQGGRGSTDFRSRKTNYYYATLNFENGYGLRAENEPSLQGVSNGTTSSVRASVQSDGTVRFNLNTVWLQKNSFDGYNTSFTIPTNGYEGTVQMRMVEETNSES